jgi:hypothetical protein
MSRKPTEEGWFWEFRAFGDVPAAIAERVAAYERRGAAAVENDDLYFVSSLTDQNVKLRTDSGLLKLKPLLVRLDEGFELYEESERLVFPMPAPPDAVRMAGGLLGVALDARAAVDRDALVAALEAHAPAIRGVRVRKRRTQYSTGDAWIELAELAFPAASMRSLGIQSASLDAVRALRDALDPARALAPAGYVEACRRWA